MAGSLGIRQQPAPQAPARPKRLPTFTFRGSITTQSTVSLLSITHYLKVRNATTIRCVLVFGQQRSNQVFRHYRTLTSLLGIKIH
jgi:hypothetical protein